LDEAHKATGKYPYCTVIEYIEQAGAKFRILALSATPGTSIKTIQSVVDTLRISRIEARSDSDPDVKNTYINVKQQSLSYQILPHSTAFDEPYRPSSILSSMNFAMPVHFHKVFPAIPLLYPTIYCRHENRTKNVPMHTEVSPPKSWPRIGSSN
jgi:hypothetical protein